MQSFNTSIWRSDSVDDLVLDEKAFPHIKNQDHVKITLQDRNAHLFLQAKMSLCRLGQVQLGTEAANLLNISQRADGVITKTEKPPVATYIEFTIKDQYFSNGDFHRFTNSIQKRALFVGKTLNFGILKAQVRKIVVGDKEVPSAYYDNTSKTIYRSKSAQMFLFLHISRELFDFAHDGDTYYEKMVSGIIPKLCKQWKDEKTNHRLTVVLFGRIILTEDYSDNLRYTESLLNSSILNLSATDIERDFLGRPCKDFYQILSLNSKTVDYKTLMTDIRKNVLNFRESILNSDDQVGAFQLAFAKEGNILEAVNLAMNSHENMIGGRELYLSSTGFSMIVVSSLNGIVCCDKIVLRLLNDRMLEYGTGLDIICLAPPPFSKTPVFAFLPSVHDFSFDRSPPQMKSSPPEVDPLYRDFDEITGDSSWIYYVPEWLDLSYYTGCTFMKTKTLHNLYADKMILREPFQNLKLKYSQRKQYKIHDFEIRDDDEAFQEYDEQVFKAARTTTTDKLPTKDSYENSSLPWEKSPKFELASSYQSNLSLSDGSPGSKSLSSRLDLQEKETYAVPIDIQQKIGYRTPKYAENKWAKKIQATNAQSRESSGMSIKFSPSKSFTKNSGLVTPSAANSSPMFGLQKIMRTDTNLAMKRWEHFYLEDEITKYNIAKVKWSSVLFPAQLPVTIESFPAKSELLANYLEYNYNISNGGNIEGVSLAKKINSDNLDALEEQLRDMLYIRLSEGFQLHRSQEENSLKDLGLAKSPSPQFDTLTTKIERPVVEYYKDGSKNDNSFFKSRLNPSLYSQNSNASQVLQILNPRSEKQTIERLKLVRSREVHKIAIDYPSNSIEVTRYIKKANYDRGSIKYRYFLSFSHAIKFAPCSTEFSFPNFEKYNWNTLDQLISGWKDDDSLKSLSFYRTRYLLIPLENPPSNLSLINPKNDTLDEEELRIAGFLRFLENFVKVQYRDKESISIKPKKLADSVSNLGVSMTTFSAASHVRNELQKPFEDPNTPTIENFPTDVTRKSVSTEQVAKMMLDSANGLHFKDRRWHLRFYERVFLGNDFVDFLIRTFQDINNREDAVEFGNELLNKGLFEHVKSKHTLLDGHYFYRLTPQYNEIKQDRSFGWFVRSKSNSIDSISEKSKSQIMDAAKKFRLSEKMMIDANKHSDLDNRQLCVLHFDTIHNPKMCYHFQIHWLLSSSYYVENLVHSWTRSAAATGFKLVETPSEQTILLGDKNPFRQPYIVRFALEPPEVSKLDQFYASNMPVGYFLGQMALELGYILDIESDYLFPDHYKLSFSHNKTPTEYSQYIHRSGACFLLFKPGNNELKWVENPMFDPSDMYGKMEFDYTSNCLEQLTSFAGDKNRLESFYDRCIHSKVVAENLDDINAQKSEVLENIGSVPNSPVD
eukprot:NODE_6_length_70510_cov_1.054395.p1 type:complete len:1398 gc:universal NODE_6_length_70510_cov_1.054395:35885-31692(-)